MRAKLTRADYAKLDHIRGKVERSEYLRLLIEARYNQERKEWLDRMRLYRQIRYVKRILAVGKKLNDEGGGNNDTDIRETA